MQSYLGSRVEGFICRRQSTLCITKISPASPKPDRCTSKCFSILDHRLLQLAYGIWHQCISECDACCQELGWIAEQRSGLTHQTFGLFPFPFKLGYGLWSDMLAPILVCQKALTGLVRSFQQLVDIIMCRDAGSVFTHLLLICCF